MRTLFFFLSLVFFIACNSSQTQEESTTELIETVVETHADGSPKVVNYFSDSSTMIQKQVIYYSNGKVQSEGSFKEGNRDGVWESFFENGNPWSLNTYNKGSLHGPYKTWFDNGQLRIEGEYIDGEEVGIWKYYNTEGVVVKEMDQSQAK